MVVELFILMLYVFYSKIYFGDLNGKNRICLSEMSWLSES